MAVNRVNQSVRKRTEEKGPEPGVQPVPVVGLGVKTKRVESRKTESRLNEGRMNCL